MIETSEDKLARILTRIPFEEMDEKINEVIAGKNPFTHLLYDEVYMPHGWTREEYHKELKRRAENRR
jgi:hypothetical protein